MANGLFILIHIIWHSVQEQGWIQSYLCSRVTIITDAIKQLSNAMQLKAMKNSKAKRFMGNLGLTTFTYILYIR